MAKQTLGVRLSPETIENLKQEALRLGVSVSELAIDRLTVNTFAASQGTEIKRLQQKNDELERRLQHVTGKGLPKKYKVTVSLTEPEYFALTEFATKNHLPKSEAYRQITNQKQIPALTA